jgi:hypothetical protein
LAIDGFAGVTPIDTRVAAVTVKVVEPDTEPRVAVIVADPMLADVASPLDPAALLTDATAGVPDCQVTAVVRSCVEWSV